MKMLFLLSRNFKGDCLLQVYFVKVKMGKNTLVDSRMLKLAKRMVCLIDLFILALIIRSRFFFSAGTANMFSFHHGWFI